jgi:DNA repair photolyase
LPHELVDIFSAWLETHFPDRRDRVLKLVREASGGRHYDSRFGRRQTGRGPYAEMLGSRFRTACRKLGLEAGEYAHSLDCGQFLRPGPSQLGLDL